ncbi:hypothetical protein [uncultured Ruegeria sp.]|uniref:hypothetical protein n=1 Tax=uncultured Ruegeria sp. TaxID=259304 RepID=UPI0026125A68|nr:hypothetical protein [uncultured Ruegeria sp.]
MFSILICVAHSSIPAASLADEIDPLAWAQRCISASEDQLDWVSANQNCIAVITSYCEFAMDRHTCFSNLTTGFSNQSLIIMDRLPESLGVSSPQKQIYEKRLELLNKTSVSDRCGTPDAGTKCAALVSFGRYLGALSLVDWVKKAEESQ